MSLLLEHVTMDGTIRWLCISRPRAKSVQKDSLKVQNATLQHEVPCPTKLPRSKTPSSPPRRLYPKAEDFTEGTQNSFGSLLVHGAETASPMDTPLQMQMPWYILVELKRFKERIMAMLCGSQLSHFCWDSPPATLVHGM